MLNGHIFVRFIYYYFGFIILGSIYAKKLLINEKFFNDEIYKEKDKKNLRSILLVVIIYIIYEILTFYKDQRNMACVNFWVIQIFFIQYILYRKEKLNYIVIKNYLLWLYYCFLLEHISFLLFSDNVDILFKILII